MSPNAVVSAAKNRAPQSPTAEQLDYTKLIASSTVVFFFFLLQLLFYTLKNI